MGQRVLTESRVLIFHLSQIIFPHPNRLNLDHDLTVSTSLFDPITTILSICLLLLMFGFAVGFAKRERLFSFCILWFLVCLLLESSVIGLEIIYDHRTYLPSMMICLMLVTLVHRFLKPTSLRVTVFCFAIVFCSFWTVERNKVWKDEISLWSDCVKKAPNNGRAHISLGHAFLKNDQINKALEHFQKGTELDPDDMDYLNRLAYIQIQVGRIKEAKITAEKILKKDPFHSYAMFNLATAHEKLWELDKAMFYYSEALRLSTSQRVDPSRRMDSTKAKNNLERIKRMIKARENK